MTLTRTRSVAVRACLGGIASFSMFQSRPTLRCLVALGFVSLLSINSHAQLGTVDSVVLRRPPRADAFVDEAVVRTVGELNALGFDVRVLQRATGERVPTAEARTDVSPPLLVFSRQGTRLLVEAYCPDCTSAVRQTLELSAREVTPDVAAIRAVETLRAALLEYAERTQSALPESLVQYQSTPAARAGSSLQPTPALERVEDRPSRAETPQLSGTPPWTFGGFVAPTLNTDLDPAATAIGWLASVHAQRGAWGLQIQADAPFRERVFEHTAGRAEVTSLRVGGALRFRFEVAPKLYTGVNGGGGVAHYSIDATANPGFVASDATHTSAYWVAEWASSYAFTKNVATGLRIAATGLTDRPLISVARERLGALGSPTLIVALGLEVTAEPW
jgi:hypothetical protein